MVIAIWQSQCIDIDSVGFIPSGISAKKILNHLASVPTNSRAVNNDYMVDLAIIVCLADFHVAIPPARVNT